MNATRRALFLTPLASPALAQGEWRPARPLTMIVAFAAGGGTDVAARTVARFMEKDLGQPVVVLNRPGAGGEIGFSELARARPDGLTIGFINTPSIVTLPIERRPRFRLEDFAPVGNIVDDPGGLWVRPDSPHRDLAALVAAARSAPETLAYGTTGVGSDDHLAMLAIERATSTRFIHAPFPGAAQVKQAVISGALVFAAMNVSEGVLEFRQGLLRPLAQMGITRWPPLPEAPTLRELGLDVVEGSMRGIAAPAGLPPEVLERLALSVRRTVEDSDFQAVAVQQALPLRFLAPAEYLAELQALRTRYQALWERHPWREG
jgi:tripartite-type tricarboxylate transporter receptor subunit TctC